MTRPETPVAVRDRLPLFFEALRARAEALDGSTAKMVGVLVVVAFATVGLVVGVGFGWRAWTQRASVPVEDLLPRVVPEGSEDPAPFVPELTSPPDPVATEGERQEAGLVVHVAGEVTMPGVVQLAAASRVIDAIEAAGGITGDADLHRLNLAAPLVDGARILVPKVGDEPAVAERLVVTPEVAASAAPSSPTLVDINSADAPALEALPGVGPATAAAIIDHRTRRGPFTSLDELLDVSGIGPSKLEQIRPYLFL